MDRTELIPDSIPDSVVERIRELDVQAPQFKSKAELLVALNNELQAIAANRGLTVEAVITLAESSAAQHDDLDRALRLVSMRFSLKK